MIHAFKTNEAYRLKELLKNILDKTKRDPKSLIDVTEQLLIVQSKLQRIDRLYAINALRGDMLEVLKTKKEELSNYIRVNKYKNRNSEAENSHLAYYLLERIMQLVTLSRGFIDLYNEYSHSEVNIINIAECIQKLKIC